MLTQPSVKDLIDSNPGIKTFRKGLTFNVKLPNGGIESVTLKKTIEWLNCKLYEVEPGKMMEINNGYMKGMTEILAPKEYILNTSQASITTVGKILFNFKKEDIENEAKTWQKWYEVPSPNLFFTKSSRSSHQKAKLIMPYIPGQDLFDILKNSSLSFTETIKLSIAICKQVIQFKTEIGAHCDLKPENIRVEYSNGEFIVKLIDFGFVNKEINFGTLLYSAPEVYNKKMPNLEERKISDNYSTGVVLALLFGIDSRENSYYSYQRTIDQWEKDGIDIIKIFSNHKEDILNEVEKLKKLYITSAKNPKEKNALEKYIATFDEIIVSFYNNLGNIFFQISPLQTINNILDLISSIEEVQEMFSITYNQDFAYVCKKLWSILHNLKDYYNASFTLATINPVLLHKSTGEIFSEAILKESIPLHCSESFLKDFDKDIGLQIIDIIAGLTKHDPKERISLEKALSELEKIKTALTLTEQAPKQDFIDNYDKAMSSSSSNTPLAVDSLSLPKLEPTINITIVNHSTSDGIHSTL